MSSPAADTAGGTRTGHNTAGGTRTECLLLALAARIGKSSSCDAREVHRIEVEAYLDTEANRKGPHPGRLSASALPSVTCTRERRASLV